MKAKENSLLGGIVSIVGALMGIVGHFILFQSWYVRGMGAESAEPGCEILLKFIHPALTDAGIIGGVLFAVAAYGFFTRRGWAFLVSVIAIVLSLQATWFINVPYLAADLPPIYFPMFFPFLLIYIVLVKYVGRRTWAHTGVALMAGLTFVLTLMNGTSSLSRIITNGAPMFVMTQRLHWIAMIGCGVISVGIVMHPTEWMRVVGLAASALELVVGIPLAYVTAISLGRFSLFALAPIGCLIFLVVLLWPGVWEGIQSEPEEKPASRLVSKPA
jgi:hypothetical protein